MAFVQCHGHAGKGPKPFGLGEIPCHPQEIEVISDWHVASVSDIGLIRTDTTLDQSQKAEKVCLIFFLSSSGLTGRNKSIKELNERRMVGSAQAHPPPQPKITPGTRRAEAPRPHRRPVRVQGTGPRHSARLLDHRPELVRYVLWFL